MSKRQSQGLNPGSLTPEPTHGPLCHRISLLFLKHFSVPHLTDVSGHSEKTGIISPILQSRKLSPGVSGNLFRLTAELTAEQGERRLVF